MKNPQPFPLPPMCKLPESQLIYSGEHVTLLSLDDAKLSGSLVNYDPENLLVKIQADKLRAPIEIKLDEIKVMSLPTSRQYVLDEEAKQGGQGELLLHSKPQDFEVVFEDGDSLSGETFGFRFDKNGIFLFPAQDDGRFSIRFINKQSLRSYNVGPRIGEVLVEENIVTEEGINASLEAQEAMRKRAIGDYLRNKSVVTAKELEKALEQQKSFPNLKLGEILVGEGYITDEQLHDALEQQKNDRNKPLGEILVELGLVSKSDLKYSLAKKIGIPFVDLSYFEIDESLTDLVSESLARQHRVVPLYKFGSNLAVAIEDPLNWKAIADLQFQTKLAIEVVMADDEEILNSINAHYSAVQLSDTVLEDFGTGDDQFNEFRDMDESDASDNLVVRLVNKVIIDCHAKGASDIHFEPFPKHRKMVVRYRKDGILHSYTELPAQLRSAIAARIKIMARLDIAEKRKPQDGKIDFSRYSKLKIELRVAILPTAGNLEDVVLRILAGGEPRSLDEMGFNRRQLEKVKRLVESPYGLFLVCGPTGSGKTTTLHSVLKRLNSGERKIWTVEDPVEITQAGLRQLQVNKTIDLTFSSAMRAFLRADPDVVMVGEMRDLETAAVAIEASLTGHMVFSTIHTNSAPESIVRLLEMGMDPFNFADALVGVMAQRLARRLCSQCKTPYQPAQDEINALLTEYCHDFVASGDEGNVIAAETLTDWSERFADDNGEFTFYRAEGCSKCDNSGYSGRMALYELMRTSEGIKQLIVRKAPVKEIRQIALKEGMRTLRQDGIEKILAGHTDLSQVHRVCSEV